MLTRIVMALLVGAAVVWLDRPEIVSRDVGLSPAAERAMEACRVAPERCRALLGPSGEGGD